MKKFLAILIIVLSFGCGLAGYSAKDIAPLFASAVGVTNVHLPSKFWHKLGESNANQENS